MTNKHWQGQLRFLIMKFHVQRAPLNLWRVLLSAYSKLRKATIYFFMSVLPSGTTRHPLERFPWKFIFEYFSKICREISSSIKIRQEKRELHIRPIYKVWREGKPTRCNNQFFYYQLLSQHVSGIIMPILRRTKTVCYCIWCTALTVLASYNAAPHNRYQPHPAEPAQYTTCSNTRSLFSWRWA